MLRQQPVAHTMLPYAHHMLMRQQPARFTLPRKFILPLGATAVVAKTNIVDFCTQDPTLILMLPDDERTRENPTHVLLLPGGKRPERGRRHK